MRAEKVAESKVLLLKVHRWMRKRQNSRPGNPFPFPPPSATCLDWGAALQSGACRLAAAYSPFPFCHFNIFNFFCTNMQCHIVSNSLSCSFPTNFLGHSCKSRHILSSEACQPACLLSPHWLCCGECGLLCSALFAFLFVFHFQLTGSSDSYLGGYLNWTLQLVALCAAAIHQSYLLFNELISFNLFAQVSVAITAGNGNVVKE